MENAHFISPRYFYDAFLHAASKRAAALTSAWADCPEFTRLMRSVFPAVAAQLGLRCYDEYYRLDAIFYAEADTKHFREGTYAKSIAVALEHENVAETSVEEMNKLQIINAPLKVLITYPWNASKADDLLRKYAQIVSDGDPFNDIATLRRQLVIFGFEGEVPEWQAFVYTADRSFAPLQRDVTAGHL